MARAALFAVGFFATACTFLAWCCLYVGGLDDEDYEEYYED